MPKIRIKSIPKQLPKQFTGGPQGGYAGQANYGLSLGQRQFDPTMSSVDPFRMGSTLQPVPRDEATAELEKNETVVADFDGDGQAEHMEVGGKRHSEGGTPLNLPAGAFVFSDTPKLKIKDPEILQSFGKTKAQTPADIAKQYDINKFKAILDDPNSDNLQKKTAQLMIDNSMKKLQDLAVVQEGYKNFPNGVPQLAGMAQQGPSQPQGAPQMKFGGKILPKAETGLNWTWDQTKNLIPQPPQTGGISDSPFPAGQDYAEIQPNDVDTWQQIGRNSPQQMQQANAPIQYSINNPIAHSGQENSQNTNNTLTSGDGQLNNNTNIPFGYRNQDKAAMALAAMQLATIKKYPAYIAPMASVLPQTTFFSPERELAANAEQANTQSMVGALSQDGSRLRANNSSIQGQALSNIGNILGRTQNQNVEVSNRANQSNADIMNKQAAYNADRMSKLYEQGVISDQQYQNALRQGQDNLLKTYEQANQERQKNSIFNQMNKNTGFYVDPGTGREVLNPLPGVLNGQGASNSNGDDYLNQRVEYYKKNYNVTPEVALQYAHRDALAFRNRNSGNPYSMSGARYSRTTDPELEQGYSNQGYTTGAGMYPYGQ